MSNNIYDLSTDITKISWLSKFPYNTPRPQQTKVIDQVLNEFKSGKKYAIVDCGTGVGKSAIGLTAAKKAT